MTRKDAKKQRAFCTNWRLYLCLFGGAMAILATCAAVRYFWDPASVQAEAPATNPQASAESSREQAEKPQSDVAAVVDGTVIRRQDLAAECLRKSGPDVLENLVNKQIILDACRQHGITITEQEVENELHSMAKKFRLPTDRWLQLLEQERGIKPHQYRNDVIWPTLALQRLSAQQVEVTDQEIQKAFESNYGPKVRVRMISVTQRERAEQLHAQLGIKPDQFASLAMEHSEDENSKPYGGVIPPIRRHAGNTQLEELAFSLKEGEVSRILHVANQYVILRCEKHLPRTYIPADYQMSARQAIEEKIHHRKMRTASAKVFQQLEKNAQVIDIYRNPQQMAQLPGTAATVNGRKITTSQLEDECIARHGITVLDNLIHRRLIQRELARQNITVAEQDIDQEITRAACSFNFVDVDGNPNIQEWLKTVTEEEGMSVDEYIYEMVWPSAALKQLVGNNVQITQEDLRKGFESNYGERVECLAIVVGDQRRAQDVWNLAAKTPTDDYFAQLAEEYSIEPVSRHNGGQVPPIRRYGGQPLVEEQAFKLKPGKMSAVIATNSQFIILRCLGRTQPVVQKTDYDSVREILYEDIKEKKMRRAMANRFDQILNAAQIDNYLAGTSQSINRVAPASATATVPAVNQPRR